MRMDYFFVAARILSGLSHRYL